MLQGVGLATNLQSHLKQEGRSLHVYNRTQSKAKPLLEQGATWADSPAEVASKCDITFCMTFDDAALAATFDNWLSGKPKQGSIFVNCSTVDPKASKDVADRAVEAGMLFVILLLLASCPW